MTDLSNWEDLIEKKFVDGDLTPRIMLPFSEYQLGNLLGLLKRSHDHENGDWFWEIIDMVHTAARKLEIKTLRSNWGDEFVMTEPLNEMWKQLDSPKE